MIKMNIPTNLLACGVLAALSCTAYAEPNNKNIVVAPDCLVSQLKSPYKILSSKDALSLIATTQNGVSELSTMKHAQGAHCGGFKDVTGAWEKSSAQNPSAFLTHYTTTKRIQPSLASEKKYSIKYANKVKSLTQQINPQNMWNDLTVLSHFQDRYAGSSNGVKAANWLKDQIETIAKDHQRTDVTAYFVKTGSRYQQPSLVVKVGEGTGPGIVVGGHMDTLSSTFENKPGADDDGTGTVTVLEVARSVIASNMTFRKPIYFIWYAAEEMGLVGSQYVVEDFKSKKIPVDAVIQLDMTGYAYHNEPTMWLINDHVDKNLTRFLETLINQYVKKPVKYSTCGYACSDHASWDDEGIPASMPFETAMGYDNPDIHSSQDVMDNLSLEHMTDYAKLGAAFVIELAEPVA